MNKLIYRNIGNIESEKRHYRLAVKEVQKIINDLVSLGLNAEEDIVKDLGSGGNKLWQQVKDLVEKETSHYKIKHIREEHVKSYNSVFDAISRAVKKIQPLVYAHDALKTYKLNMEYFICKDNIIHLSDELNDYVEENHSLYSDAIISEVLDRAEKLKNDIENFEMFLREHGDILNPIGGIDFGGCPISQYDILKVGSKMGKYSVQLDVETLTNIYTKAYKK